MDNSDDYVLDDIVLDDQTLAVLDQEERKYLHESSHSAAPILQGEPVHKRHKTNAGWVPGAATTFHAPEDYDDLPEISLQGDGSYGVSNRMNMANKSAPKPTSVQRKNDLSATLTKVPINLGQAESTFSRNVTHAQALGFRPPTSSRQTNFVNPRQRLSPHNGPPKKSLNQPTTNAPIQHDLQTQMLEMQKKLEELREENSKAQAALKDAIELKLAKEGEVSILRKNIEKTSQAHAAQIIQLKSEKEKSDAKQIQMQKEMKDEMERLRTQFIFKQQELESSIRKPPVSVRAKKAIRGEFPSTPLVMPTTMRGWNPSASRVTISERSVEETPLRPSRLPPVFRASPTKQMRKSPEKNKKSGMLPGFQNAFETSTPLRSPSRRTTKGKGKMEQMFGEETLDTRLSYSQQMPPSQFQPEYTASIHQPIDASNLPTSSNASVPEPSHLNDDNMDMVVVDSDEEAPLEDIFEPINWKAELCRLILTHSHLSTDQITFQYLLSSTQFVNNPSSYSASCATILGVIATSTKADDYEESLRVVAIPLLSILAALTESRQILQLAILLNLFTKLIVSLPAFQSILLTSHLTVNHDESPSIIDVISTVIVQQLGPTMDYLHRDELSNETLSLLESLCFHLSPESMQKFQSFAHNREVLMILLHPLHPAWYLERSSRLLALLSSNHGLCEVLLSINANMGLPEPIKDPFIDRLCSHLIDANRLPTDNLKTHILIYFAQLSIAHPSAHAILVGSYALVPSLILHISQLTSPLWEDDGQLASSPEATSSLIQLINQTLCLLYHLIFGTNPCLNLRHKLQEAPQRPFNTINHIFIVTFGRLSYCDPPSWVNPDGRQELEYLAEIARDILEVVVDGPEGDSVWAAFQSEPNEGSAIDEGEMEARLMGIDMS